MNPFVPRTPSGQRAALTEPYLGTETQATPVNAILDTKEAVREILADALREIQNRYPNRFDFEVMTTYPKSVMDLDPNPRNNPKVPKVIITVSRVNTPEFMRFMGNVMLSPYFAANLSNVTSTTGKTVTTKGNLQNDVIEIAAWTLHPILRDKMMVLIRQLMFEKQDLFYSQYGVIKCIRTGGRDDEVDVGKLPRTIYRALGVYALTIRLNMFILDDVIQEIITIPEIYEENLEGVELSTPVPGETATPVCTSFPTATPVPYFTDPLDAYTPVDTIYPPATPMFPGAEDT